MILIQLTETPLILGIPTLFILRLRLIISFIFYLPILDLVTKIGWFLFSPFTISASAWLEYSVDSRSMTSSKTPLLLTVTKIWCGVDGNAGATSKNKISTFPRLVNKTRSNRTESERFSHYALDICNQGIQWQGCILTGNRGMFSNKWGWFGRRRKRRI